MKVTRTNITSNTTKTKWVKVSKRLQLFGTGTSASCVKKDAAHAIISDSSQSQVFEEQENEARRSKKQRIEEDWAAVQDEMAKVGLSLEQPAAFMCHVCLQPVDKPIRCLDCHSFFICCSSCEVNVHQFRLHKPEIWQVIATGSVLFAR